MKDRGRGRESETRLEKKQETKIENETGARVRLGGKQVMEAAKKDRRR